MSNVQITKQHKNVTTEKLNMNPLLIHKEVSLIFRWLEVVHSFPPPDDFEEVKASVHQRNTRWWIWGDCPRFPQTMGWWVGWSGFKWLVHNNIMKKFWLKFNKASQLDVHYVLAYS